MAPPWSQETELDSDPTTGGKGAGRSRRRPILRRNGGGSEPGAPPKIPGLFSWEYGDFSGLGQPLNDLGLVVCVVDAGLPELSGVAVLLPVVVPVPTAVRPEAEDVDLEDTRPSYSPVRPVRVQSAQLETS